MSAFLHLCGQRTPGKRGRHGAAVAFSWAEFPAEEPAQSGAATANPGHRPWLGSSLRRATSRIRRRNWWVRDAGLSRLHEYMRPFLRSEAERLRSWTCTAEGTDPVAANPLLVGIHPVEEVLVGVTGVPPKALPGPLRHPVLLGFGQGTGTPYPLRQSCWHRRQVALGEGPLSPPVHRSTGKASSLSRDIRVTQPAILGPMPR